MGMEMARTHQPDLVTLDLQMPDLDGWEVLKRLKADQEVRHIPVVIVITIKRLTPEEEHQLADMASSVVIKDQGFVSQVRAHLATLFPPSPCESEVQPTAD
jgi:CheY-like chemotaxis protein